MNTPYEAWARYDVEKELERVDALEEEEQKLQQHERKVAEKRNVEDIISRDAEVSAEVLSAQAAVAALKAKGRGRARGKLGPQVISDSVASKTLVQATHEEDSTERLRVHAELVKRKHELIKSSMDARRRADQLTKTRNGWHAALNEFKTALSTVKEFEELVPRLLDLENANTAPDSASPHCHDHCSKNHDHDNNFTADHSNCTDHAHESHEHSDVSHCGCSPHHERSKPPKQAEKLPSTKDLRAIVKMFLIDCYVGIGTCEMEQQRYARAAEAFKEVLLQDETHLLAWLRRGKAFEAMDAPLLAWLHYNRVTSQDPNFEDAKVCEDRIKKSLLEPEQRADSEVASAMPLSLTLEMVQNLMEAGNCIMIEGFHNYAIAKFTAALRLLASGRMSESASTAIRMIDKLGLACHLNIASAYYEMQKNLVSAADHCHLALQIDPNHGVAKFRLAQIHQSMHSYNDALDGYASVKESVGGEQRHAKKLDEAIDKCKFDRGQYDAAYIRQLMDKGE